MASIFSNKKILVDGSNVANEGLRVGEPPKIRNILLMIEELKKYGFTDIQVFCDASLFRKIDDQKLYDEMKKNKIIIQTPAYTYADEWIIDYIKEFKTKLVTNDGLRDLMNNDDWVNKNIWDIRVTFMIVEDKVKIKNLGNKKEQTINANIPNNDVQSKNQFNTPQSDSYFQFDFDELFQKSLKSKKDPLFNDVQTRLAENDFLRAYGLLSQIIREKPNNAQAYLYRAYANRQLGNTNNAINDYTSAIDIEPENLQAYIERGTVYVELGQLEDAIRNFTWVIDHDPTNKLAESLRDKAFETLKK
jgi:tetratricopeptide (TPR) repeat protein